MLNILALKQHCSAVNCPVPHGSLACTNDSPMLSFRCHVCSRSSTIKSDRLPVCSTPSYALCGESFVFSICSAVVLLYELLLYYSARKMRTELGMKCPKKKWNVEPHVPHLKTIPVLTTIKLAFYKRVAKEKYFL